MTRVLIACESGGSCMNVLDLFSAACGGWSLGMHRAGFRTMAACEAVDWRRVLYSQNNPGVKVYDDVRTLTARRLLADFGYLPSVIVGSPPCQDISSANTKGKGVDGERSGLFFEAVRIIGECRPRWFALENSANLRTRGADRVVAALAGISYTCWPFVVGADDVGANHERKRSWLIGCDLEQVTDADGIGSIGFSGRGFGIDASVSPDTRDASQDGCRARLSRGYPGAARRAEQRPCGDVADTAGIGLSARPRSGEGADAWNDWRVAGDDDAHGARNTPHPDQARQARQAHGCMVSGIRQEEIADDGCGDGRSADRSGERQMGLCPPDRRGADGSGPLWSLANLAGSLLLDDGLPVRLAGTRVAVGGPRGTAAASLAVEAYGDAVIPQIPEAIGRAILRVEHAMRAVAHPQGAK